MDNVKKIYTFNFFWLFCVLLPVLYPYYATLGINMHQFFQLQAVFGLTVALLDIPTGYFSDRFGRKLSIALGGAFTGLGYIVLLLSDGYWGLFLHEIILGIALSFVSGADIAILYDSLPISTVRTQYWQALGKTQLAFAAGESLGAILCGVLVAYSYQHVLYTQVIIAWFPFLVALTLSEPKVNKAPIYSWKNVHKMWNYLLNDEKIVRRLSLNFVMWLLATYIIIWMVQKFWRENNVPLVYFGLLWAAYNLTMGLSAYYAHTLEKKFSASQLLRIVALMCCGGYLAMAVFGGWVGIVAALALYSARGFNNVVSRDILNLRIPSELRATANSILNFLFRIFFALVGPLIGYCIDHFGSRPTLFGLGVVFLIIYIVVTLPLEKLLRSSH